ncbi:hypothetical protein Tco_0566220 [Tanacetum coccineum]
MGPSQSKIRRLVGYKVSVNNKKKILHAKELCGIIENGGDEIELENEDGYCNGGNLPGAYHIGNSLHYQDLECDDESSNDCWEQMRWKTMRYIPTIMMKRYKMIKYSFKDEEEYVAAKEDEYDDLTITSEEAYQAYQEIFRMMDEGWMVMRTETLEAKKYRRILVENLQIWKS